MRTRNYAKRVILSDLRGQGPFLADNIDRSRPEQAVQSNRKFADDPFDQKTLTSSIRFASGYNTMYSMIVPFGIQFETMQNLPLEVLATPRNGSTCGCDKCFQNSASLKNLCITVLARQG